MPNYLHNHKDEGCACYDANEGQNNSENTVEKGLK